MLIFLRTASFALLMLGAFSMLHSDDMNKHQLAKDFPPPGIHEDADGKNPPPPPPPPHQELKELLRSLSDSEREELKKLQLENPEAFREKMKEKMNLFRTKKFEEDSKIKELAKKYISAKTDADKAKALDELKTACSKIFDERMENNLKGIKRIEERLSDLKEKYKERLEKKDEILNNKIKDLTKDPSLEW